MTPERLKKVEEIYHAVLDISPPEREQFLKDSCGEDDDLRREVESLLSFDKTFVRVIDAPPNSLVAEIFSENENSNIIGTQINQYKILSLLGEGGMGKVFLAQDTTLERKVAVKFLFPEFAKDAHRLNRFFLEAKAASALNHPNIITVYEIGKVDNKPFIVTEFIDGKTLSQYLKAQTSSLPKTLDIAAQIASALTTAHEAGIIHRDIKPDNVMIRGDGIVKVLDFGLAKLEYKQNAAKIEPETATLANFATIPGMVMGTPQYMSPEQARGQKVDLRSDIFSFGVLLYEMISGKRPFDGLNALDTIGSILKDEPIPIQEIVPDISYDLEHIVSKSLRKDREQRYQHIKDLLIDLNDVKKTIEFDLKPSGYTAAIRPQKTSETMTGIASTRRFSLVHALGFLLVAVLSFGAIWWFTAKGGSNQIESALKTAEVVNWASSPGEIYSVGSFSPDAKMIAFASTKSGTKNIWVKQTTSGEAIQITKDEFLNDTPTWSPDGEELAFFSTKGNQAGIWRIPHLGGSPKLVAALEDPSSRLRFWSKNNLIYYESKNELYAVEANSGQTNQITDFKAKAINAASINISADEQHLVYVLVEDKLWSVWSADAKGNSPNKLFSGSSQIKNTVWHPDNKRVFYSSPVDGTFQIFVADISASAPKQLTFAEKDSFVLNVSADGTKILFGSAKEESDVWGVNLKDNKEFIVASDIDSELWADVSPDGKTIAYQSIKNLSQGNKLVNGNLLTKNLNANEQPLQLISNGFLPKWSPDGKAIAFLRLSGDKYQIETINVLGGEQKSLTKEGISPASFTVLPYNRIQTSDFSWSPNNNKIAYISDRNGQSNIWLINADGSSDVQLTENNDSNLFLSCPLWSADGKRIAFTTKTNNTSGKATHIVQIIDTETKKYAPITSQNTFIRLVGWSQSGNELILASVEGSSVVGVPPQVILLQVQIETGKMAEISKLKDTYLYNIYLSPDKKTIAFAAHREGKDNVWLMAAAGGEAKQVTGNNDSRLYFSSLAWSPDNNSIFFGKQSRYSLLSMLTNFK